MAVRSGLKVMVDMKTKYGTYQSFPKEFKDRSHLENWIKYMHDKSEHEIIGTKIIEQ